MTLEAQDRAENLGLIRIWVSGVFLVGVLTTSFRNLGRLPVEIMHPPGIMEWLSWKFYDRLITPTGMQCLQLVLTVSLIASMAGVASYFTTKLSVLLVVLHQGILRSFGHFNHDEMAGIYFLFVLSVVPCSDAYSVDNWVRRQPRNLRSTIYYTYPVWLMQAILAWIYFSTGLLKLRIGGLNYFSADQLPVLAIQHSLDNLHDTQSRIGFLLPSIRLATPLLLFVAVLWELTFPLGVVWRKSRWWYLGFGVLFHIATMLLMNIAFWNQLCMYVAFADLSQTYKYIKDRLISRIAVNAI